MIDLCSVETRVVKCSDVNAICDVNIRPPSERTCNLPENVKCGKWIVDQWSPVRARFTLSTISIKHIEFPSSSLSFKCSVTCGHGTRSRLVKCHNGTLCSVLTEPHSVEVCTTVPCPTTTTTTKSTTTTKIFDDIFIDLSFRLKNDSSSTTQTTTITSTKVNDIIMPPQIKGEFVSSSTAVKSADILKMTTTTTTSTKTTSATTTTVTPKATTKVKTKKIKIFTKPSVIGQKTAKKKTAVKKTTVKKKIQINNPTTKTITKMSTKKKVAQRSLNETIVNTDELTNSINNTVNFTQEENDLTQLDNITLVENETTSSEKPLDVLNILSNNTINLEHNETLNETLREVLDESLNETLNETHSSNILFNDTLSPSFEPLNETISSSIFFNETLPFSSNLTESNSTEVIILEEIIDRVNQTNSSELTNSTLEEPILNIMVVDLNPSNENIDENSIYSPDGSRIEVEVNNTEIFEEDDEIDEFEWQKGPFGPVRTRN